jgi:predicted transcriptional regulator
MFDLYEKVKDEAKFFISSDVRAKILISLKDGSKNLADLRQDIPLSSSTILHGMSQLEKKKYIFRDSGNYSLSQTGEIVANKLMDVIKSIYTVNKLQDLFLHHNISSIPIQHFQDIGFLESSFLIKSTETDIMKPHDVLLAFLSKTKNIKYLSSVFNPSIAQIFFKTMDDGGKVEVVLTSDIMDKLIETANIADLKKLIESKNLKLRTIKEKVKLNLTIGDDFIALGLFSTSGTYDLNIAMISQGKDALEWGNSLYQHFKKQSSIKNIKE